MFIANKLRYTLIAFTALSLVLASCKKKEEDTATPSNEPSFRGTSIDYTSLTSTTAYNNALFNDANGDSTVDRRDGQNLLRMLNALNAEARKGSTAAVSASLLSNMFFNTGSPFAATELNTSAHSIYNITATSKAGSLRDDVITDFNSYFNGLATASASYASTATSGNAGVLTNGASKYLVDARGIELPQLLQKSMMGSIQLDYIGNYLLDEGLDADNSKLVEGQKYTALEHNWDMAFGLYSLNSMLYIGYTDATAGAPKEGLIGSYIWEYNKSDYSKMNVAFLRGRAAIMNGDMTELRTQATFIRKAMEYAIAAAGVGYLKKWIDNTGSTEADDAIRAHAIGEGSGFLYSLRFCYLNGADEVFSDAQITTLGFFTGNGFWDLTANKISTASTAIKTKFKLAE